MTIPYSCFLTGKTWNYCLNVWSNPKRSVKVQILLSKDILEIVWMWFLSCLIRQHLSWTEIQKTCLSGRKQLVCAEPSWDSFLLLLIILSFLQFPLPLSFHFFFHLFEFVIFPLQTPLLLLPPPGEEEGYIQSWSSISHQDAFRLCWTYGHLWEERALAHDVDRRGFRYNWWRWVKAGRSVSVLYQQLSNQSSEKAAQK